MWFGSEGFGVSKFDGSSWSTYTTADGLVSNHINAIGSDPAGNVWFGAPNGLSKFDGSTWKTYTVYDGLASNSITAIANDPSGNVWVGTDSGVSELVTIHLDCNYAGGAPGSYFNLNGDHFTPNQSTPISVNGFHLGDVPISSHSTFTFTLSTDNAGEGIYLVKVGDQPALKLRLMLDAKQPMRPKEGDYIVIDIPAGIALTPRFYLPALQR